MSSSLFSRFRSSRSKDISKNITKDISEIAKTETSRAPSKSLLYTSMTKLIIRGPFTGIRKHFVSFSCFFELHLCFFISGISIGMVFHCQATESFFDFSFSRRAADTKEFVIIAF
nr:putative inorganic polyphosphate/ATP-NAD kinase [Candidatus Coxiella mudrowiae]